MRHIIGILVHVAVDLESSGCNAARLENDAGSSCQKPALIHLDGQRICVFHSDLCCLGVVPLTRRKAAAR